MAIPEAHFTSAARQALIEILREGPQFGARLRVLLFNELKLRLPGSSPELAARIPKLGPFLAEHADILQIKRGHSDLVVSLRSNHAPLNAAANRRVWFRSEVWQAFLNPDPNRRRFFNRSNGEVAHYVVNSPNSPNKEIEHRVADDPAFVEVTPIQAEAQSGWMREFLDTSPLIPDWTKRTAEHFVTVPFTSSVNTAFVNSLQKYSGAWRSYRFNKVEQHIRQWAQATGVPFEHLQKSPELMVVPSAQPRSEGASADRGEPESSELLTALHRLADLLRPEDLTQIQIPASVVVRLMRDRTPQG